MKQGINTAESKLEAAWREINAKYYHEALNVLLQQCDKKALSEYRKKNYQLALARAYEGLQRYNEAKEALNAIPKSQQDEGTRRTLVNILRKQGLSEEAKKFVKPSEINAVFDAIKSKKYSLSLKLLDEIDFENLSRWDKRDYHLAYAKIYLNTNKLEDALAALDKIHINDRNDATQATRAICLERLGRLSDATATLKGISRADQKPQLSGVIARHYGKTGKAKKEIEKLEAALSKNIGEGDTQTLISLAIAYQKMGKLREAKQKIELVKNLYKNEDAVLTYARILSSMGKYDEAEMTLKKWVGWEKNPRLRITLARFYEETDRFQDAIDCLQAIEGYEEDRQVNEALGQCYFAWGKFDEAEKYFQILIDWENTTDAQIKMAYCKMARKAYDEALFILENNIEDLENNLQARLAIIKCHQAQGKWVASEYEALAKRFPSSEQAQLSAIVCQESRLESAEIKRRYKNFIRDFHYFPGYYNFCRYLVERKDREAWGYLEKAIKDFPDVPRLYLLKAKMYREEDKLDLCLATLNQNVQQFPYHVASHLALIRHHLLMNDIKSAIIAKELCLKLLHWHEKLPKRIADEFSSMPLIRLHGYHDLAITDEEDLTAVLPEVMQREFDAYNSLPGKTYLVGSAVSSLIPGCETDIYDLDFVNSSLASAKCLEDQGFGKNKNGDFYNRFTGNVPIDVTLVDLEQQTYLLADNHAIYHALRRDFTKSSLLYDGKRIIDPTGMGIRDAKARCLRMIGHPEQRLVEDPTLLIRAMKDLATDHYPEITLEQAIRKFNSKIKPGQRGHIDNLTCKYLLRQNGEIFVAKLIEYGLYQKLFGLIPQDTIKESTRALKRRFGLPEEGMIAFPINLGKNKEDAIKKENETAQIQTDNLVQEFETFSLLEKASEDGSLRRRHKDKEKVVPIVPNNIETTVKTWTPLANIQAKQQANQESAPVAPKKMQVENTESGNVDQPQEKELRSRKNKKETEKLINVKKLPNTEAIISKVLEKLGEENIITIDPSEFALALERVRDCLDQSKVRLSSSRQDVLADKITDLLKGAIYDKAFYQHFAFWKSGCCYNKGVHLDSNTDSSCVISEKQIKGIIKASKRTRHRKLK